MKVKYGLMPLLEWHKPMESLKLAVEAEKIGFDSVWADDHFMPAPPLTESTFAWTWMSSALQATEKIFFSTAVTAPVMRYNPAVVAQAFATMGVMYPGRVGIGLGSGEELNEVCVVGSKWPSPSKRLDMLAEAVTVMTKLWTSAEPITFRGTYYTLDNAAILTKPENRIPMYFSGIGPQASKMAGLLGDHLITLATDPKLVKDFIFPNFEAGAKEAGKDPKEMERAVLISYMYDPDRFIDPKVFRLLPDDYKIEVAKDADILVAQNAEDLVKKIEGLTRLGFDHIIFSNMSVDGELGVKVFKDVLPHVV